MEKSLIEDLYRGYISKEKNLSEKESEKLLKRCLRNTSERSKLSEKIIEDTIFSLSSILKFSMNYPLDEEIMREIYDKICYHDFPENQNETEKYFSCFPYIFKEKQNGFWCRELKQRFFYLVTLEQILNNYRYIDPKLLESHLFIANLNNMLLPSIQWIKKQKRYIQSLTSVEKSVLDYYKYNHHIFSSEKINNETNLKKFANASSGKIKSHVFYNNKSVFKEYYKQKLKKMKMRFTLEKMEKGMSDKKTLEDFLKFYYKTLENIILKSPKVDKDFIVYCKEENSSHGKKEYISRGFETGFLRMESNVYHYQHKSDERGFVPKFIGYDQNKIIIPKDSRVLYNDYISGTNGGVTFSLRSKFKILGKYKNIPMFYGKEDLHNKVYSGGKEECDMNISSYFPIFGSQLPGLQKCNLCISEYIPSSQEKD